MPPCLPPASHLNPLHPPSSLPTHPLTHKLPPNISPSHNIPPHDQAAAGDSLAANLISVTLKNLSFGSGGSLEPTTKKLPTSLTVGRLRLMVKQLFGLDPPLQHLSIRVYKDALPTFLDDDMATIGYYGALDGAEVYINEAKA